MRFIGLSEAKPARPAHDLTIAKNQSAINSGAAYARIHWATGRFDHFLRLHRTVAVLNFLIGQQSAGVGLVHDGTLVQHIGAV
jgi:hypothetical protein